MADEQQQKSKDAIEPGMLIEATKGDLGEEDVSKPRVADVVRDAQGHVEEIVVRKGLLFKEELEIPVDRIQAVEEETPQQPQGKVMVDVNTKEIASLSAGGHEQLLHEKEFQEQDADSLLEEVEEAIPTAEGLRGLEEDRQEPPAEREKQEAQARNIPLLRILGPGFLGGMAGNDSSAVASYSVDGAQNGFGHLWLLLLATPLYQCCMYACAQVGRITQKGLAEVLREHYGQWIAGIAASVLIIANIALIAADLVAIGSGLELLVHINWVWFVVPVAAILWYLTVFRNFESIKRIFILMSLVFVVYIITAVLAKPNWGSLLFNTFVPHIDLNFASVSSAVALLGATISPYNIFWQVQGEKEEIRPGTLPQKMRFAALDISTGVISGNLIAYAIIASTAATLFVHHKSIVTAVDAAQSLVPVLGPFAEYLFAIGLIGAGVVAIPILLASTSYAVAGTFGWPSGLSKKPWQNEGFYLILTFALVVSLALALIGLDPIRLLFWANVLAGVLSPVLIIYVLLVGNNRKIMGTHRLSLLVNIGLIVTVLVMTTAAVLLFYGLTTGQAGA